MLIYVAGHFSALQSHKILNKLLLLYKIINLEERGIWSFLNFMVESFEYNFWLKWK